jgi:hypothetical protein
MKVKSSTPTLLLAYPFSLPLTFASGEHEIGITSPRLESVIIFFSVRQKLELHWGTLVAGRTAGHENDGGRQHGSPLSACSFFSLVSR